MKLQHIEFESFNSNRRLGTYNVIENAVIVATIVSNIPRRYDNEDAPIEYSASTYDMARQCRDSYIGYFSTLIAARAKVMNYLIEHPQPKAAVKPQYLPTNENNEFYPTPTKIAGMMLSGIDWAFVKTVLEPTAGKGDLANCAKLAAKGSGNHRRDVDRIDVDCIEIDSNLRHILKGEGFRVIHLGSAHPLNLCTSLP